MDHTNSLTELSASSQQGESNNNGYLDPDQTIVNYAVRELGTSFAELHDQDPSKLLREWLKTYRNARGSSIACTALGAVGIVAGVFTGATPLLASGVAIAMGMGFLTKKHHDAVDSIEAQIDIVDQIQPVFDGLCALEDKGIKRSHLVSIFDRLVKLAAVHPQAITGGQLREYFETEVGKAIAMSDVTQVKTGLESIKSDAPKTEAIANLPPSIATVQSSTLFSVQKQPSYEDAVNFDGVTFDESDTNAHLRFDWSELRNADTHPMIAIAAPMDGGKSRLTKWLAKHVLFGELPDRSNIVALDVMGADWEWDGCKVVSDYRQMVYLMACDIAMQQSRLEVWRNRQPNQEPDDLFFPVLRILEEFTASLPALKSLKPFTIPETAPELVKAVFGRLKTPAAIVDEWKLNHGSITRKLRSRAVFISTELTAEAFDMSAGKRSSMTLIFPGTQGMNLAMNDSRIIGLGQKQYERLRGQLLTEANKPKRAALIYSCGRWMVGEIPELDEVGDAVIPERSPATRAPTTASRLKKEVCSLESEKTLALPTVERDDFLIEDDDLDPAIELISEIPDQNKREALMIAYQWASKRLADGREISKDSFLERARKDRHCTYLKDNRESIWDELSGLIF